MKDTRFCFEGHAHDPLCDPALALPRREPHPDPVGQAHAAHMAARNQAGWLSWQNTRPLTRPRSVAAEGARALGSALGAVAPRRTICRGCAGFTGTHTCEAGR